MATCPPDRDQAKIALGVGEREVDVEERGATGMDGTREVHDPEGLGVPEGAPGAGVSLLRRGLLAGEMIALFGGVPALMALRIIHVQLWPALVLGSAGCVAVLLLDRTFERARLWNYQGTRAIFRGLLPFFGLSVVVLGFGVLVAAPERFFQFPRERPQIWLMVMALYPILSVYPQEVIFRAFFFQRYGPVFASRFGMIAASAIAFGWAHIILHNWIAVTLSTIGGALFAWTYERSKSLLAVSIEHALYGCAIFTLGLGWYFYLGAVR